MANLSVDFKDDILAPSNPKRKYQLIHNSDGTVSLEDVTVYQQNGSNFGAKEVNEERTAINKINNDRIVSLDEIDLVNQPGFFVDALAVKELNSTLKVKHQQAETIYFIAMIEFKKYGHLVNAYINTELRHSLPADTDTFIATIPEEYRPVDYDYNAPLIMTGRHVGIITFLSNGNIMAHPTEFLDPGWLNFNITYIV